jgi:hypothetical protein
MNYETPVIVFSVLPVSTQGLRTPYIPAKPPPEYQVTIRPLTRQWL